MKYSTYTWDLVLVIESASPASNKTSVTFIDSIRPNDNQKKAKNPEMRLSSQ